jgi:hypothetical protein
MSVDLIGSGIRLIARSSDTTRPSVEIGIINTANGRKTLSDSGATSSTSIARPRIDAHTMLAPLIQPSFDFSARLAFRDVSVTRLVLSSERDAATNAVRPTGSRDSSSESRNSGSVGVPAVIATEGDRQLFYTVLGGDAAVIVLWQGTTGDVVTDRAALDVVLSTLEWTVMAEVVPGSSIANAELQTDTIPVVETLAIATHDDCGGANVVNAEVIGGDIDSWIEHWTVQTCGGFDTYEVTFTLSSAGGTDIAMGDEPEAAYGHTH